MGSYTFEELAADLALALKALADAGADLVKVRELLLAFKAIEKPNPSDYMTCIGGCLLALAPVADHGAAIAASVAAHVES